MREFFRPGIALLMNQRNKATGVLSFATFFLSFGGSAASGESSTSTKPCACGLMISTT